MNMIYMPPQRQDIILWRGVDWIAGWYFRTSPQEPNQLSLPLVEHQDYARMQIRVQSLTNEAKLITQLDTDNGGITVDSTGTGTVIFSINAAETLLIDEPEGVYDVLIRHHEHHQMFPNVVRMLQHGNVEIMDTVTKL